MECGEKRESSFQKVDLSQTFRDLHTCTCNARDSTVWCSSDSTVWTTVKSDFNMADLDDDFDLDNAFGAIMADAESAVSKHTAKPAAAAPVILWRQDQRFPQMYYPHHDSGIHRSPRT